MDIQVETGGTGGDEAAQRLRYGVWVRECCHITEREIACTGAFREDGKEILSISRFIMRKDMGHEQGSVSDRAEREAIGLAET